MSGLCLYFRRYRVINGTNSLSVGIKIYRHSNFKFQVQMSTKIPESRIPQSGQIQSSLVECRAFMPNESQAYRSFVLSLLYTEMLFTSVIEKCFSLMSILYRRCTAAMPVKVLSFLLLSSSLRSSDILYMPTPQARSNN